MSLKLVTSESMRQADRQAIDKDGIPSLTLMENAGKGVAEWILSHLLSSPHASRVLVFSGTGNNGGDGFVVARSLFDAGVDVSCVLVGDSSRMSADCRHNFNRVTEIHIPVEYSPDESSLPKSIDCDVIVDALCGTGFNDSVRGVMCAAIRLINESGIPTVAVDVPSGVNADDGAVKGEAVRADFTCTLQQPKFGLYCSPGREHAGAVTCILIGIPDSIIESIDSRCHLVERSDIERLLPLRRADGNKFDFGTVLIVGGSTGMTGAPALAAESALRAGCGMVRIACPVKTLPIIAPMIPEATTISLADVAKRGSLALRGLGDLKQAARNNNAVVIGPGIGRHFETSELVRRFVAQCEKPLVIDADGLNAFEGHQDLLVQGAAPRILTPHAGEFKRITGEPVSEKILARIEQVSRWSRHLASVIVLKGSPTLIAGSDGKCFLNPTGNNGMATGGSGDVLSGVIGSLVAQGLSPLDAAIVGVYLHGLAGDVGAERLGVRSVIARDIIAALPDAFTSAEI